MPVPIQDVWTTYSRRWILTGLVILFSFFPDAIFLYLCIWYSM